MREPAEGNGALSPRTGPAGGGAVPVAVIDDRGGVVAWNDAARRLTGCEPGDAVGRQAAELIGGRGGVRHGGGAPALTSAWRTAAACRRLLRRGEPWSYGLDLAMPDGTSLPVRLEAVPLDRAGAQRHWLLSAASGTVGPEDAVPEALVPSLPGAVSDGSPVGIGVWDRDLTCVWLNDRAAQHLGLRYAWPGTRLSLVTTFANVVSGDVGAVLREVLTRGAPVLDYRVTGRTSECGTDRVCSVSAFRLEAAGGTPLGVCAIGVGVGEEVARHRLSLLNRASQGIGTTLSVMATAQELADAVVPGLADYATVDLAESAAPGHVPAERPGSAAFGEPAFVRGGLASVTPGAPEAFFSPGERVFLPPSSPIAGPLSTGRSRLEADLDTGAPWLDEDPARARAVRRAGMHSAMFLPLRARGALLGVAVLGRTANPAPFTPDDLLLAEELVARAALSIDNAGRYSRERSTALALQRTLLPGRIRGGERVDVAFSYLPTDRRDGVGGDWCDVIPLPRGRTALVVGDVMGHGIQAAASMGQMRTAVHTLAAQDMEPAALLAGLDAAALSLARQDWTDPRPEPQVRYATCVYAVHDPATGRCSMARAGHPPPLLLTPDGHARALDLPAGAPLGIGHPSSYRATDKDLPGGSVLALYTDGLVESRTHDIDAGLDRLARALERRAGTDLEDMCSGVVADLTGTGPADDDVALLLTRPHGRTGQRPAARGTEKHPAGGSGC